MMTFLENLKIFYWFLTTRGGAWHVGRVCLYNVCMQYVCLSNCQTITFERLNVENAYLHIRCQVRMKVIRSGSVGHMSKKDRHWSLRAAYSFLNYAGSNGVRAAIFVTGLEVAI